MVYDNQILKNVKIEDIVFLAQQHNMEASDYLMDKFKPLVQVKSRAYFLIGADSEDIMQEGMIGLYKAVRDFDHSKCNSFHSFAELCIHRQILTAIKMATRQKHQPLNTYISFDKPISYGETEQNYLDLLEDCSLLNPELLFIGQENKNLLESQMMKELSVFENKVLALYLQGRSYMEIGHLLKKSEKSIDNALQRVKKKLEKFLCEKYLDE